MKLSDYEQTLLEGWEDVYKKGQLTLWVLLALHEGPKHMSQIKEFIAISTNDTQTADDQSMYRALRRYDDAELVQYETVKSSNGPDLKIYSITQTGHKVLATFVKHNVTDVLMKPEIKQTLITLAKKGAQS